MPNPPCWPEGQPPPNRCAAALFQRVTSGNTELHGEWAGWRIAGRELITPQRKRVPVAVLLQLIEMHYMRMHFDRQGVQRVPPSEIYGEAATQGIGRPADVSCRQPLVSRVIAKPPTQTTRPTVAPAGPGKLRASGRR